MDVLAQCTIGRKHIESCPYVAAHGLLGGLGFAIYDWSDDIAYNDYI